ncbi:PREDICTED: probable inorganic phosphate transporter 1-9 [Fragaria vesca subsp. vesca]|uniref:probable inorganic phosphate transporter 1-9 n=1 Tax=Fragaria vesca subsp. vesca TaxID=101020 RepID=UPI0002C34EEF|nr:PREDICTED: probable inorganic phosphate transporter 1-9 [Fragaria vesca subsp. vesca]
MALKVLSALDTAKTQWYHFKAIIIAGMGLFTDAYDLFCIPPIMRLLGRIYYDNHPTTFDSDDDNFVIPALVVSAMVGFPLLGTILGQLLFGRLGDLVGRRHVYGLSLMVMVLSSIGCGFSICTSTTCVLVSLGFFRFLLGVGIGGDYPLSATIMSEFANKKTRGSFIAAVFSMQGFGILASSIVTIVVCAVFNFLSNPDPKEVTPDEADIAWRLILMLGAIPAAMTYYWRMMMPETARYTALVELNVAQAAKNMEKVLAVSLSQIAEDEPDLLTMGQNPASSYPFFSKEFLRLHGRDLFSCAANWFLVDIVFYSSNLFQSQIYRRYIDQKYPKYDVNLYQDALHVAELQAIVTICSTIPGYWFTVYFIDRIGRRRIQMMGFFVMALVYFSIGIPYTTHWAEHTDEGFMVLYGLTFFFANFGPNTTTFIVPAELFPARFRSTCHGVSGALGKVGALIGSIGFLWAAHGQNEEDRKTKEIKMSLIGLGVVCILGLVVTYLFTPETRGRSLEENENENENGNEQHA